MDFKQPRQRQRGDRCACGGLSRRAAAAAAAACRPLLPAGPANVMVRSARGPRPAGDARAVETVALVNEMLLERPVRRQRATALPQAPIDGPLGNCSAALC